MYATTRALDDLRAREYPVLDGLGQVYLDYTAGNLVPLSLVDRHLALLRDHLLGNPHSTNPASALATTLMAVHHRVSAAAILEGRSGGPAQARGAAFSPMLRTIAKLGQ